MKAMRKDCMTPHVMMHSLFGLGLGLLLAAIAPTLAMVWVGLLLMVIAIALDYLRKG